MPKELASVDDYLICIGNVSHHASAIDMVLCNVFRIISGLDTETAIALFYTPDASTVKFGLIKNLIKIRCNKEEQGLINDMISNSRKTNSIRNEMAHSFFHKTPTEDIYQIRLRHRQPRKPIPLAYLQSNSETTKKYVIEAVELYGQLCDKREVPFLLEY